YIPNIFNPFLHSNATNSGTFPNGIFAAIPLYLITISSTDIKSTSLVILVKVLCVSSFSIPAIINDIFTFLSNSSPGLILLISNISFILYLPLSLLFNLYIPFINFFNTKYKLYFSLYYFSLYYIVPQSLKN